MNRDSVRIRYEEQDEMAVIILTRDILDEAEDLAKALQRAVESGKQRIVFDMSGAKYISARVLDLLAHSIRKTRNNRGELKVICPNRCLRMLMEMMGFGYAVEIMASMDEALHLASDGILSPEKMILWRNREVHTRA